MRIKTLLVLVLFILLWACPREKQAPSTASLDAAARPPLKIYDISFAGPAGHRPDRNFARGESVICLFTVSNFTYSKQHAHIVGDVQVSGPEGQIVLRQTGLELIKGKAPTLLPGTLRTAATLTLTPAVPPGRFTVNLTVRDLLGRRTGSGQGTFTIPGVPPQRASKLALTDLHVAADDAIPAGAMVPVTFQVTGFAIKDRRVDLTIRTTLRDASNQIVAQHEETLLRRELLFEPAAYPVEHVVHVPKRLPVGRYQLFIEVRDLFSKRQASDTLGLRVLPATYAIFNLHVHDAAGLARNTFLLGEQIFVRLSVHGLNVKDGRVDSAVDLAVAGPDGGVYIAQKNAATRSGQASEAVARAGRFPMQLPLILPTLCPTGKYRIVVRARDNLARRETVREHEILIQGSAPAPLASFKVDQLDARDRPDLPTIKGDTFGAGRTYHLQLRLGGVKLDEQRKMTFRTKVSADLRLRDLAGTLVHESKELFRHERVTNYRPLRILIPAKWTVPSTIRGGMYNLEIVAHDLLDDRVSQFIRRVEIVGLGPAPELKLP